MNKIYESKDKNPLAFIDNNSKYCYISLLENSFKNSTFLMMKHSDKCVALIVFNNSYKVLLLWAKNKSLFFEFFYYLEKEKKIKIENLSFIISNYFYDKNSIFKSFFVKKVETYLIKVFFDPQTFSPYWLSFKDEKKSIFYTEPYNVSKHYDQICEIHKNEKFDLVFFPVKDEKYFINSLVLVNKKQVIGWILTSRDIFLEYKIFYIAERYRNIFSCFLLLSDSLKINIKDHSSYLSMFTINYFFSDNNWMKSVYKFLFPYSINLIFYKKYIFATNNTYGKNLKE